MVLLGHVQLFSVCSVNFTPNPARRHTRGYRGKSHVSEAAVIGELEYELEREAATSAFVAKKRIHTEMRKKSERADKKKRQTAGVRRPTGSTRVDASRARAKAERALEAFKVSVGRAAGENLSNRELKSIVQMGVPSGSGIGATRALAAAFAQVKQRKKPTQQKKKGKGKKGKGKGKEADAPVEIRPITLQNALGRFKRSRALPFDKTKDSWKADARQWISKLEGQLPPGTETTARQLRQEIQIELERAGIEPNPGPSFDRFLRASSASTLVVLYRRGSDELKIAVVQELLRRAENRGPLDTALINMLLRIAGVEENPGPDVDAQGLIQCPLHGMWIRCEIYKLKAPRGHASARYTCTKCSFNCDFHKSYTIKPRGTRTPVTIAFGYHDDVPVCDIPPLEETELFRAFVSSGVIPEQVTAPVLTAIPAHELSAEGRGKLPAVEPASSSASSTESAVEVFSSPARPIVPSGVDPRLSGGGVRGVTGSNSGSKPPPFVDSKGGRDGEGIRHKIPMTLDGCRLSSQQAVQVVRAALHSSWTGPVRAIFPFLPRVTYEVISPGPDARPVTNRGVSITQQPFVVGRVDAKALAVNWQMLQGIGLIGVCAVDLIWQAALMRFLRSNAYTRPLMLLPAVSRLTKAFIFGAAIGVAARAAKLCWESFCSSSLFVCRMERASIPFVPHMVSSACGEYGSSATSETVNATVSQKLLRMATLPLPDDVYLHYIQGTQLVCQAVMATRDFFRAGAAGCCPSPRPIQDSLEGVCIWSKGQRDPDPQPRLTWRQYATMVLRAPQAAKAYVSHVALRCHLAILPYLPRL